MKKYKNFIANIVAIFILITVHPSMASEVKNDSAYTVTTEAQANFIDAPLVDDDLYYYRADGSKVSFLRKKDVYLLKATKQSAAKNTEQSLARIKSRFKTDIKQIKQHSFGAGTSLVRLNTGQKTAKQLSPGMLKAADPAITKIVPVLASAKGQGDIVLLSGVTVSFKETNIALALQSLQDKYELTLKRRLKLTGNVYSLAFKLENLTPHEQLLTVRNISKEPAVKWVEPHIYSKPIKTTFEPNDPLFNQQWHLRNTGQKGARCDADCDANNAWGLNVGTGAVSGANTVIAIVDDGVQLNHPDLDVDTVNDKDFVDDTTACGNDGTAGPDNDASPNPTTSCALDPITTIEEDNHGTAVAGIAAAVGNNNLGVTGVAYSAEILPIRAISDYNSVGISSNGICGVLAEAIEYAGRHADVVNNSWRLIGDICGNTLSDAITEVVNGTQTNPASHRPNKGSPVVFAAGNDGSGWLKFTVPVSAGKKNFEWRFLRDTFTFDATVNANSVWLDDINWPANSVGDAFEGFEAGLGELASACTLNSCNGDCSTSSCSSSWGINNNPNYARTGSQSAMVDMTGADCDYTYLSVEKEVAAGDMSFWIWVSTETNGTQDKVEFLIDGKEIISFGDRRSIINEDVAYPASLSSTINGVIAVGASNNGDLSGNTTPNMQTEGRAYYSQFGPALDVLAPSSNQHQLITTTDRTGVDGYNTLGNPSGSEDYTDLFGGTSAAAPIVSGVAAAMIAVNPNLSAQQIRQKIRDTANKIGPVPYVSGRNDFHGYGRVNMARALQSAAGNTPTSQGSDLCNGTANFTIDFAKAKYQPQPTEFCTSPLAKDEICVPIKAKNNNVALICL